MTSSKVVVEAFTELASGYEESMDRELTQFWGFSYQAFVDKILALAAVKRGEKVLDLATGKAVIPMKLKSVNGNQSGIVGLDITLAMLTEGRKAINRCSIQPAIDLVCASAMEIPFGPDIFEVVICGLGTHHMDVPRLLGEARRVLAAEGRLVVCDVGATRFWRSLGGQFLLHLLLLMYGFTHQGARARAEIEAFANVRTVQEWSSLLRDFGYLNIHIGEIPPRKPWYPCGVTITADVGYEQIG